MPLLELTGIRYRAGGRDIVQLDKLSLGAGGRLLLLGPSGSGKTTLLCLMAGLLRATSGDVVFDGTAYGTLPNAALDQLRRGSFGFIFQKLHLIGHLSVEQNIRLASDAPDAARIAALTERLGLAGKRRQSARDLSHGEAQRTAIARALAGSPRIVFADEPTSALDDANAAAVARLLLDAAGENDAALVAATHDARLKPYFTQVLELAA